MPVRVVTDSSSSVPDSYLDRLGIIEVPATVHFGQESFLNKVGLSLEEFYRRLEAAQRPPTTSQPTPEQFAQAYARAAAEGADAVVAVCVSGRLSGTLQSAVMAAEDAPLPVHPWDSEHVSMGSGWQAIAAAEMAHAGRDVQHILERLAGIRARVHLAFTPANLRYIIASGRVPKLRGTIGDLLNIRPIMTGIQGRLEPTGQARSQRRALAIMIDRLAEAMGSRPARLAVGHARVPEEAAALLETSRARINVAESLIFDVGTVLGALAGPGLVGICCYALEGEP